MNNWLNSKSFIKKYIATVLAVTLGLILSFITIGLAGLFVAFTGVFGIFVLSILFVSFVLVIFN